MIHNLDLPGSTAACEIVDSPPPPRVLRHRQDVRTLVWSLVLFPLPPILALVRPSWTLTLVPVSLYLGFCSGVLAHNQNHRPVFVGRLPNRLYSLWLSVFYGLPLWAWIPTHNQNHHKHVNAKGDATRTDLSCPRDSFLSAVLYPWLSTPRHLPLLRDYLARLRSRNRQGYAWAVAQVAVIPVVHGLALETFLAMHEPAVALYAFSATCLLPAAFASWSMMFINYLQHVGCDPHSPHNHSRNFVGQIENWLVFSAGLHTVHHERPGAHFSRYRALHEARQHLIDPSLNQRSFFLFFLKRYFLPGRAVLPKGRRREVSRAARYGKTPSQSGRHEGKEPSRDIRP